MVHPKLIALLVAASLASAALASASEGSPASHARPTSSSNAAAASDASTALDFDQFYRRPVGPYGLEPTETLLALDGARVRITGFMVDEEAPLPGRFLLAPLRVALSEVEDGPADDLPPAVIFVHLEGRDRQGRVVYQKGRLTLTGLLQVGNRDEPDGRVSMVRLVPDRPVPARARDLRGSSTRGVRPSAAAAAER